MRIKLIHEEAFDHFGLADGRIAKQNQFYFGFILYNRWHGHALAVFLFVCSSALILVLPGGEGCHMLRQALAAVANGRKFARLRELGLSFKRRQYGGV